MVIVKLFRAGYITFLLVASIVLLFGELEQFNITNFVLVKAIGLLAGFVAVMMCKSIYASSVN